MIVENNNVKQFFEEWLYFGVKMFLNFCNFSSKWNGNIKFIQKSKNHQRRIFLDNYLVSATLSSVKFGENCNFEVKCLLNVKLLKFIGGSCQFYSRYV
jgi:hypothetical protein